MIKIIANMPVKAAEIDRFLEIAHELVEKSAAEEGNVSYSVNRCMENENVFAIMEIWKDDAAIEFHNATEHFTTLLPKLAELCEGDIDIAHYTEA